MRLFIKRTIFFVVVMAAIYAAVNWQYFKAQINYYLHPPQAVQTPPPASTPGHPEMSDPNRIRIPSLGIDAPVIYVEEKNEDAFQRGLENGPVHFPGTALPGESGNVYIFGHSSDFPTSPGNYKTVFALLPKIDVGAIVEVTGPDGQVFRYRVDNKIVVDPKNLSVLEQDYSKKQLSIQTSYPIGTALRRYVVVATLIE